MTTATRSPQVWRGYDALAQADEPIGSHYSPHALHALRWFAVRPGTSAGALMRAQGRRAHKVQATMRRLRLLDLVAITDEGTWRLTEHGRELVALIDEEGII
jgi:hypothetical protein